VYRVALDVNLVSARIQLPSSSWCAGSLLAAKRGRTQLYTFMYTYIKPLKVVWRCVVTFLTSHVRMWRAAVWRVEQRELPSHGDGPNLRADRALAREIRASERRRRVNSQRKGRLKHKHRQRPQGGRSKVQRWWHAELRATDRQPRRKKKKKTGSRVFLKKNEK
jgi:hypothetical protein